MSQGSRPDRVADLIRAELAMLLTREVHDPGIGFVTLTRVQVSPDIQQARIYYTALGDESARKNTSRALERAGPFLRRQIGSRLRLKRVPELKFFYDESIAGQDRIEQLLNEIRAEPAASNDSAHGPNEPRKEGEREWGPASRDDDDR
jgi:ribosome-binding factor A